MHRTQNPTGTAAETDNPVVVTPAGILRGAARYLEEHGWNRGDYYADVDHPFPPACAAGAIAMAAFGRRVAIDHTATDPYLDADGLHDYHRALDVFCDYLGRTEPVCRVTGDQDIDLDIEVSPFIWNDDPQRHGLHVVLALNAAAKDYERTHPVPEETGTAPLDDPLVDTGGYLPCGCHGSQREHTCGPLD